MSGFPNLSNIEPSVSNAILKNKNKQLALSGRMPWFRAVSLVGSDGGGDGGGLIIDSTNASENFNTRYGSSSKSGIVGKGSDNKTLIYAGVNDEFTEESRGLRPSPTIETLNVQNGTEGLTRKVNFTIRCYTLSQAEVVAAHFSEPASYILIEWGWNTSESLSQIAGGGGAVTTCDVVYYSNLAILKDKRAKSNGTYDAFLGVVTGGGIKYGQDESFDVEVKLVSQGELPAYLSSQKGSLLSIDAVTSGIKFTQGELDSAEDEEMGDVGKFLFMQMYNELPLQKQIGPVKKLGVMYNEAGSSIDSTYTDSRGLPWTHPSNFLNMDEQVRVDLINSAKDVKLRSKDNETIKVPEDIPLISGERYIRFELAYKILSTIDNSNKTLGVSTGCTEYVLSNGNKIQVQQLSSINITNTICRAHRHMFSTDKSKLFVPNTNLPDFQLTAALKSKPLDSGSIQPPNFETVNAHPMGNDDDSSTPFAFPATNDGVDADYSWDTTIITKKPLAHEHGYLKDLYVNYDFFLEVIQRRGLLEHEALTELLNGMSSAVNMMWDFQIVEAGRDGCGDIQLHVVDKTYLGLTKEGIVRKDNGIPDICSTVFQARGVNSVFLEADLNIDIPGAMANMVIAQKNSKSTKKDPSDGDANATGGSSTEERFQNMKTGIFSGKTDPVSKKLTNINEQVIENEKVLSEARRTAFKTQTQKTSEDEDFWGGLWDATKSYATTTASSVSSGAQTVWHGEGKSDRETRKANYKFFISKAGVFPKINDRNLDYDIANEKYDFWGANNANLEDIIFVGCWNDTYLLKKYEMYDRNLCLESNKSGGDYTTNPVLLPIKFSFTIHGVSGIKVGDIFAVSDLPKKYANKIFQVTQVEHQVSDIWTTQVQAQLRNI